MRLRTMSIIAAAIIIAVGATAAVAHNAERGDDRREDRRDRLHAWAEECQKEHTTEECREMARAHMGHHRDARMERCMENHSERECRQHFQEARRCHADPEACRRG